MHWRSDLQRHQTPLAVRHTGVTTTKLWLAMAACLSVALALAAVLA
jgi:hypothetical protein